MEGLQTAVFQTILSALVGALIGALLGALMTYVVMQNLKHREALKAGRHNATLLYWDLYSIEKYTQDDYSSTRPGIHYSEHWQLLLSPCTFLTEVQTSLIFQVYELVYDYNFFYQQKFSSELEGAQHTFHTLTVVFNSKEWKTIQAVLKEHIGQK